jgi:hypothetical protein
MGKILMLNDVRCAFLVLGEPEDYQGNGRFRWSATALVRYDSPIRAQVEAVLKEVAKAEWEKKWESKYEAILSDPKACCWTDGKRKAEYAGYAGHFVLTAHRPVDKGRPLVMDNDKSPIYKPSNEVYEGKAGRLFSGCYVNMQVEFYASKKPNEGLRCGLLGVQRNRIGDAFGGGAAPDADAFGEITDGADADDLS